MTHLDERNHQPGVLRLMSGMNQPGRPKKLRVVRGLLVEG